MIEAVKSYRGEPIRDEAKVIVSPNRTRAGAAKNPDELRRDGRKQQGRERANDCQARHAGPD